MRVTRGEPSSDYLAPLTIGLLILIAIAGAAFAGGIWLFQPTVVPNRGMAAYKPPVATALIPPPHKMDAPELALAAPVAAEPELPQPAVTVAEQKPAPAKHKPAHKRARTRPKPVQHDPTYAYADGRWGNGWGGPGRTTWGGGWRDDWSNRW